VDLGGSTRAAPAVVPLARRERREVLLDAAAKMVAHGQIDAVSMESVAEHAGVSRALVYKHFANRAELLSALYERESTHLHASMAARVQRAQTLEEVLRAFADGALEAQAVRGATFAALLSNGGRRQQEKNVQRRRDVKTLRYFTRLAVAELNIDEAVAQRALGLALSSIYVLLEQWRQRPTAENAVELSDTFVAMTIGGLKALARTGKR
jgi:AcrR family transcriptional regulator